MIRLYESVPYDPTVRSSTYYDNDWLYVYRYEKTDKQDVVRRMLNTAAEMTEHGYQYKYVNPSWGAVNWCCVTIVSYWASVGCGQRWVMGSPDQGYLWSPRYGGDYDMFLLNAGFTKYNFNNIGYNGLKDGDIVQSWGHAAMVYNDEKEFEVSTMPTIKKGSSGNVVKNLQALLNLWMCQSGQNEPLLVDGDFGDKTEHRLKDYQWIQGLVIDGICGYQTWSDILLS